MRNVLYGRWASRRLPVGHNRHVPQPNALVQLVQPQRLAGTCSLDALRRVREVVETASGGTPCAAAGRRSTPCAAPSAAGNAVAGGPSRAASTRLSLAQRAGEEPPHRRPPTEHARPARAFRATFGSQLTRTHALARQKHALLVAFAESEGGRHEGAPARARPARGCMVGCLYTSEEGVFRNSEFYRRFGCLSR